MPLLKNDEGQSATLEVEPKIKKLLSQDPKLKNSPNSITSVRRRCVRLGTKICAIRNSIAKWIAKLPHLGQTEGSNVQQRKQAPSLLQSMQFSNTFTQLTTESIEPAFEESRGSSQDSHLGFRKAHTRKHRKCILDRVSSIARYPWNV